MCVVANIDLVADFLHSPFLTLGFYAGLVPAMVGITPQMGLNFAFYETFRAVAMPDTQTTKDSFAVATLKKGFCGGAAGGLSKLIVYPLVSYSTINELRFVTMYA